jgi:hypothetical protein
VFCACLRINGNISSYNISLDVFINEECIDSTLIFESDWGFSTLTKVFFTLTEGFPCVFLSRKANARV